MVSHGHREGLVSALEAGPTAEKPVPIDMTANTVCSMTADECTALSPPTHGVQQSRAGQRRVVLVRAFEKRTVHVQLAPHCVVVDGSTTSGDTDNHKQISAIGTAEALVEHDTGLDESYSSTTP